MDVVIITGAPYSGKGTQCEVLKEKLKYEHLNMGELCRIEQNSGSDLGKLISSYTDNGNLAPNEVILDLFVKTFETYKDAKGVILDGYPRRVQQVDDLLDLILFTPHIKNFRAVNINVDQEILLSRALERAKTSTRVDDRDPSIHIKRIEVFQKETLPAVNYMREVMDVFDIEGVGEVKKIAAAITKNLR